MKIFKVKNIYICITWLMLCGAGVTNAIPSYVCRDDIPATTPTAEFTLHNDGTVTHHATGLMWMRCSLGQVWDEESSICTGEVADYNWQSALQAAEGHTFAGHSDWRIPNKNELKSIVEHRCYDPAINLAIFPLTSLASFWTSTARFWTSTPSANSSDDLWSVRFFKGYSSSSSKNASGYVRLVRADSD